MTVIGTRTQRKRTRPKTVGTTLSNLGRGQTEVAMCRRPTRGHSLALFSRRPPNLIKTIAGWLLLLLVLYFLLSPLVKKGQKAERPSTYSTLTGPLNCAPKALPPNGATQVADPSRSIQHQGVEIIAHCIHRHVLMNKLNRLGPSECQISLPWPLEGCTNR